MKYRKYHLSIFIFHPPPVIHGFMYSLISFKMVSTIQRRKGKLLIKLPIFNFILVLWIIFSDSKNTNNFMHFGNMVVHLYPTCSLSLLAAKMHMHVASRIGLRPGGGGGKKRQMKLEWGLAIKFPSYHGGGNFLGNPQPPPGCTAVWPPPPLTLWRFEFCGRHFDLCSRRFDQDTLAVGRFDQPKWFCHPGGWWYLPWVLLVLVVRYWYTVSVIVGGTGRPTCCTSCGRLLVVRTPTRGRIQEFLKGGSGSSKRQVHSNII